MSSLFYSFFWFLLPIAALSGWYIGGRSKRSAESIWEPTPKYIASLNRLLNQRTSKAIESLIDFFEVNPTTVYTHIILGNLFRERGELEKAIRLHQNIVSHRGGSVSEETTIMAALELGRDYLHAGLLDSAEKTFSEVIKCDSRSATRVAHKKLVDIYEREKSWNKAIASAKYLKNEKDLEYELRIVHYHNEMAQDYLSNHEYQKAKVEIMEAKKLSGSENCRTTLLLADIEFAQGNKATALHLYSNIFSNWQMYAQVILPKLKACFPTTKEFSEHLQKLKPEIMTVSYIVTYMQSLIEVQQTEKAEEFVCEMIDKNYAPIGMLKLFIEYHMSDSSDSKFISHITDALKLHADPNGFACSGCGFKSQHLYWNCPKCHAWEKIESIDVIKPNPSAIPFINSN